MHDCTKLFLSKALLKTHSVTTQYLYSEGSHKLLKNIYI